VTFPGAVKVDEIPIAQFNVNRKGEVNVERNRQKILTDARLNRLVPMSVTVVYSGIVHKLAINLIFTV
jgi:hypothetical protein